MPDATSTPWLKFETAFKDYLTGGNPDDPKFDGLQLVPTALEAAWDDPVHGPFIADELWANAIPEWDARYIPNPGHHFDDSYYDFLTNLDIPAPDPATQQAVRDDIKALADTKRQMSQVRNQAISDWHTFDQNQRQNLPASDWQSFDDWYAQSGYPDELAQNQTLYEDQLGKFGSDANKAGAGWQLVGDALTRYNNPLYQATLLGLDGSKLPYRTWSLTPDLATWLADAKAGNASTLDLVFDHSTTTSVSSSFKVDGGVAFDIGFFGVAAHGGFDRSTLNTTSNEFKMEVKAQGFVGVLVGPGSWYRGDVVETFKNGPYIQDGPFGPGKAVFFGPSGVLALLPTIIYVAYKPAISVSLTNDDYQKVTNAWKAGGAVVIGPFAFGGTGNGANDTETHDDQTQSVTLVSQSPRPLVLAVENSVMPA